jgi:hypothetical protein
MVWSAVLKVSCAEGVPKVPPPDPVAAAAVTLISTPGITAFNFTETLRRICYRFYGRIIKP